MNKFWQALPKWLRETLMDVVISVFVALGVYNLAAKSGFAPGGISGLSIAIQEIFHQLGIDIGLGVFNLLFNVPMIIFAWRYLGGKFLLRTFRTVVISSIFIDYVAPLVPTYSEVPLLAAIFSGLFIGVGLGIAFNHNTSTGGLDLVTLSLKKIHPQLSVGQLNMILNAIIIILGGVVFQKFDAVLYGFVSAYMCTRTIDAVMNGVLSGKFALIITSHGEMVSDAIMKAVIRGCTLVPAQGAYTKEAKHLVLCAISRQQLPKLRQVVEATDPQALVIITEYSEVLGTGFQPFVVAPSASRQYEVEVQNSEVE